MDGFTYLSGSRDNGTTRSSLLAFHTKGEFMSLLTGSGVSNRFMEKSNYFIIYIVIYTTKTIFMREKPGSSRK